MLKDYVVIDLEMTGLNAKKDKILELGAVRVRNGEQVATFSQIVNPRVPLSENVMELTGITNEMAEKGIELDEGVRDFFSFIGEDVIVGQNVIFDYSFLKQWAVNHKISFERKAVDTLKLARKFLPEEEKKNLESLCKYFGVERRNAHRALDDAIETGLIFEKMKLCYGDKDETAFIEKPLQYKPKKQTPATARQIQYLKQFAVYHGIEIPELQQEMTRSEASRLTDQLISRFGKLQAFQE